MATFINFLRRTFSSGRQKPDRPEFPVYDKSLFTNATAYLMKLRKYHRHYGKSSQQKEDNKCAWQTKLETKYRDLALEARQQQRNITMLRALCLVTLRYIKFELCMPLLLCIRICLKHLCRISEQFSHSINRMWFQTSMVLLWHAMQLK